MSDSVLGVIPARFASRRFEGKLLAELGGKPLVEHVYKRSSACSLLQRVIVATDDERIRDAVVAFGGSAVMTSPDHRSGTDRVAEVAASDDAAIIVNIQGDEPFVNARVLEQVVRPLLAPASPPMATLCKRIERRAVLEDPNVVKVVRDLGGRALYFSRSPVPYPGRNRPMVRGSTSGSTLTVASFCLSSADSLRRSSRRSKASSSCAHWSTGTPSP